MIYVVYVAERGDLSAYIPVRLDQPPGGESRLVIDPDWWLQRISRPAAYFDRLVVALKTIPGGTIASGIAREHLQSALTWVTLLPEEATEELSAAQLHALPERVRASLLRGDRATLADVIHIVREQLPGFPEFPHRVRHQ